MVTYIVDGSDITDIADAIRLRSATSSPLEFPDDFVNGIESIPYDSPPTGTINVTENGSVDVTHYATANVNVPAGIVPTGTIDISTNGTINVSTYEYANVNVPGIIPVGTKEIAQNGTFDVASYESAHVDVPGIVPEGTKNITVGQNGVVVEDVTSYENARVTVNVHIGDFSQFESKTVTASESAIIEISHSLNVVPKLVTVEASAAVSTSEINKGYFTPDGGFVVKNTGLTSSWYSHYTVATIGTNVRTFQINDSSIIIRAYNNSSCKWSTTVSYTVKFYA